MAFEFFRQSGRGFRPRASIRRQGQIGLNQGAVRRFTLKDWEFAILGYDRDKNKVALQLTNEDQPGAQRVNIKGGSASVSARSFLEYFAINYQKKTIQYDVEYDQENNVVIIPLGSPVEEGVEENTEEEP